MRDDRRKVMRSLKNSMAKAKRLRDKARTLSEEDMLQILKNESRFLKHRFLFARQRRRLIRVRDRSAIESGEHHPR